MTDDEQSPSLGGLLGDLPPLPDTVWERLLETAFDPNTPGDANLVPEMTDVPVLPDDEPALDDALFDDTDNDIDVDHDDQSSPPLHPTDDHHHHHHDGDDSSVLDGDELQMDLGLDHIGTDPSDTPEPHPGDDPGGPDLGPGSGEDIH